ncbi:signal peptidase I [Zavarzinella formosa]|uniref:signal peptidase I n=1 Tax=Zavarzinella formosa TaxID=360055 RepID=UPI0002DF1433|nr:signal peptidase I [Zavarzinella formosa]
MKITAKTVFNLIIGRETNKPNHGDPSREVFETVVFVVVLVLMLKLFVAEAFVIPTGSMASTLYGDQFIAECPECSHRFPVSASVSYGRRMVAEKVSCQNCGHYYTPENARDWNSGDRVLVAKYEYHLRAPRRFDVPVFKYPEEPYHKTELTAMNYIKRLIGLPGETIAIYQGDLYRTDKLTYANYPRPDNPLDLWQDDYMYANRRGRKNNSAMETNQEAADFFMAGNFEMIRKSPDQILAVRRLVFDLDQQPKTLEGTHRTRWHLSPADDAGWKMLEKGFEHEGEQFGWMSYHHIQPGWANKDAIVQPALIRDHLAYNIEQTSHRPQEGLSWVPDLLVECKADFKSADAQLILELVKSGTRYQAVFANGTCKLVILKSETPDKPVVLAELPSKITTGEYSLRLANVDSRLTVWVNNRPMSFGDLGNYDPPNRTSFAETALDVEQPSRIGAKGNVTCSKVKLWRDVFYTCYEGGNNASCGLQTYYVQPGHYLCLGDNSTSSSDGRYWGLVPERLLLGRAAVIYWPASRWRVIE